MSERRWSEDGAPPEVKSLLESAVIDEPTVEQLAALRSRVDGLMSTPPGAAAPVSGGIAAKIIGGVTLLTLGVGGGLLLARREEAPPVPPPPVVEAVRPVVVEEPLPVVPEPVVIPPKPVKRVEAPPPPPPVVKPSVDEELELLQSAMRAPSPDQSLSLVEQHVAKFPESSLAQEREVLAVKALMQAERVDEAKARAAAFRARWPTSPHLLRVESLISK